MRCFLTERSLSHWLFGAMAKINPSVKQQRRGSRKEPRLDNFNRTVYLGFVSDEEEEDDPPRGVVVVEGVVVVRGVEEGVVVVSPGFVVVVVVPPLPELVLPLPEVLLFPPPEGLLVFPVAV